jgi:hypothetical protein
VSTEAPAGSEARLSDSPVGWVCAMLWPDAGHVGLGSSREAGDERTWWVVPSVTAPRLLVPTARRAAATSLRQFNDSLSILSRLRKVAVGEALRLGVSGGRFRRLTVAPGADELVGSVLPRVFGVDEVDVAVSLGRALRPNLKPVLQILTKDGRVLGYAKVGWNEVSRVLLDTEARALERWSTFRPEHLRVPQALYRGSLGALDILVLSPVPHPVLGRRRSSRPPAPVVMGEVIALDELERAALRTSGDIGRLRERLARLGRDTAERGNAALDAVADREVWIGRGHGDWAPWNMTTMGRTLHVWDWERSFPDVLLGLDPLHFSFEVAYHKRSAGTAAALARAVRRAARTMAELGLMTDAEALSAVYVVERLARLEEGRAAGVPVDERLRTDLLAILGHPADRA